MNKFKIMILIGLLALSACGNSKSSDNVWPQAELYDSGNWGNAASSAQKSYDYYANDEVMYETATTEEMPAMDRPMAAPMAPGEAMSGGSAPQGQPAKIIQNANINLQTDRFDEVSAQLRAVAPDMGGYVEQASRDGNSPWRSFSITLRVPIDRFEEARAWVEALAQVTWSSQSTEDVTANYYSLADRLETKKVAEERVLEMIARAELIEDLLALEEQLGSIRTQIEQFEAQMTSIDRLAAFSTIYVRLSEVTKEELVVFSDDLGGRIKKAFTRSVNNTTLFFQDFVIWLAGALIPLVTIGILILVSVLIARKTSGYRVLRRRLAERAHHRDDN